MIGEKQAKRYYWYITYQFSVSFSIVIPILNSLLCIDGGGCDDAVN